MKEVADYQARLVGWYTKGGFNDEYGKWHASGHHYKIAYWEVLNEIESEQNIEPGILYPSVRCDRRECPAGFATNEIRRVSVGGILSMGPSISSTSLTLNITSRAFRLTWFPTIITTRLIPTRPPKQCSSRSSMGLTRF